MFGKFSNDKCNNRNNKEDGLMKFTDMRRLLDRSVQLGAALYWNLICTDKEALEMAKNDKPEVKK
jgi:hypothetical protein